MIVAMGRRCGRFDQSRAPVETWVPCSARVLPEKNRSERIRGGPEVQVADLRAFGAGDAEEMPRRHLEGARLARRDGHGGGLRPSGAGGAEAGKVWLWKGIGGIADHRGDAAAGFGVGGWLAGGHVAFPEAGG